MYEGSADVSFSYVISRELPMVLFVARRVSKIGIVRI